MRFTDTGRLLKFALVAALLIPLFCMPVLAAPVEHKGEGEHKSEVEHKGEHEDKLAFTGYKRYDLGIYTLLVFGILVAVLRKYAWPSITEGLQKREAAI